MQNFFEPTTINQLENRLNKLVANATPQWGSMNAAQMLAHCNVSFDMLDPQKYPPVTGFKKWMMKLFVKNIVVGNKPYKKNSPTAPEFKVTTEQDFDLQKANLLNNIKYTSKLGAAHWEGKKSRSFGKLTATQWSTMHYKHIDHHLAQFGV